MPLKCGFNISMLKTFKQCVIFVLQFNCYILNMIRFIKIPTILMKQPAMSQHSTKNVCTITQQIHLFYNKMPFNTGPSLMNGIGLT